MIQNLAYCALVEDQMQMQVPYGLVIYAGEQVRRVEYNEVNRLWLHKVIAEVRMARTLPRVTRNHQMPGRCSGCGLRQQCASLWRSTLNGLQLLGFLLFRLRFSCSLALPAVEKVGMLGGEDILPNKFQPALRPPSLQQQFSALFTELRKCFVAEGIENPSIASDGLLRGEQTGFDPTEHSSLPYRQVPADLPHGKEVSGTGGHLLPVQEVVDSFPRKVKAR
jgi:hypothetical protein